VLDSAGRMQLPRAHIEALGLAHRVRLRLADDHVGVFPDGTPMREAAGAEAAEAGVAAETADGVPGEADRG
jgi:hypothetical protein